MHRIKDIIEILVIAVMGLVQASKSQAAYARLVLEVSVVREGVTEAVFVRNVILAFRKRDFFRCEVYGASSEYPVGDVTTANWRNLDSLGACWQESGEGYLGAILAQLETEARVGAYPGATFVQYATLCSVKPKLAACLDNVPGLNWSEATQKAA